jgi:hypothetical protein
MRATADDQFPFAFLSFIQKVRTGPCQLRRTQSTLSRAQAVMPAEESDLRDEIPPHYCG